MATFVTNLMIFNNDYSNFKEFIKSNNSICDFDNIKQTPEDLIPTRFVHANSFYIEKIIQYSIIQDLLEFNMTLVELKNRLIKLYQTNEDDKIGFNNFYFDSIFNYIEYLLNTENINELLDKLYNDILMYVKRFDKDAELSLYGPINVSFSNFMKNNLKVELKEYIDKMTSQILELNKFSIRQIGHFYYKFLFKYGVIDINMWHRAYWGSASNAIKPKWYKNMLLFNTKWTSPNVIFKRIGYKFPNLNINCYSVYESVDGVVLYTLNEGKISYMELEDTDSVFKYNILPLIDKIEGNI